MIRQQPRYFVLLILGLAAVLRAEADLPHAVAVLDAAGNRLLLFDPHTGAHTGEIALDAADHLTAPLDCDFGPEISYEGTDYADTLLVSDFRKDAILAFNAADGAFIKTIVSSVDVHGITYERLGRILVSAGNAGIRVYKTDGTFLTTLIPQDQVEGPYTAWDLLLRPLANNGAGDMLVSDPTLDAIFRFDLGGNHMGVFAKIDGSVFVEQLSLRENGHVLAVDPLGNAVTELDADGNFVRGFTMTHPRGVVELLSGNLLIASEDGVQVYDGETGALLETVFDGFPTTAPRYVRYLRCRTSGITGDMNGDKVLDLFDIDAFVLGLVDPAAHAAKYPTVDANCAGDINKDGRLDLFDIVPFTQILVP